MDEWCWVFRVSLWRNTQERVKRQKTKTCWNWVRRAPWSFWLTGLLVHALSSSFKLWSTVPLRAPELSLTSRSPTDIQVSWQPLPDKLSRGRVCSYRLSYRTSSDSAVSQIELPGEKTQHLLENLQPDTIYLLRIVAATSVGWGEQSAWTSHRTPKASGAQGTWRIVLITSKIEAFNQKYEVRIVL